jgi:hypothetical protein
MIAKRNAQERTTPTARGLHETQDCNPAGCGGHGGDPRTRLSAAGVQVVLSAQEICERSQ